MTGSRSEPADGYERLVSDLGALLYRHDPIGIALGDNPDEYEPEARSIVPRLPSVETLEDVRRIVHEELVRWFDADTAGAAADHQVIAEELWTSLRSG